MIEEKILIDCDTIEFLKLKRNLLIGYINCLILLNNTERKNHIVKNTFNKIAGLLEALLDHEIKWKYQKKIKTRASKKVIDKDEYLN